MLKGSLHQKLTEKIFVISLFTFEHVLVLSNLMNVQKGRNNNKF